MASSEEPTDLRDAAIDSQLQQARLREEAADNLCPICLGKVQNPSYINICFHIFCLNCIQRWMYTNNLCPICRLPFDSVLHTVRADDDYQEYKVRATNFQRGRVSRWRGRSRPLQQRYFLRPRPTNNEPTAGIRGPRERQRGAGRDRGRVTSSSITPQDALDHSVEGPVLRSHMHRLRTQFSQDTEIE